MQGKVLWFKQSFGFATYEGHPDIFLHWKNIVGDGFKTLSKDDLIEYDVGQTETGRTIAINITKVESK